MINVYYYQRIRDVREDRDMIQADVAKILNITREQYNLYETGKRELPLHHLITLCGYYNISADYILGFTNNPKPLPIE